MNNTNDIQSQLELIQESLALYLKHHSQVIDLENQLNAARSYLVAADKQLACSLPFSVDDQYLHTTVDGEIKVFRVSGEALGQGNDIELIETYSPSQILLADRLVSVVEELVEGASDNPLIAQARYELGEL